VHSVLSCSGATVQFSPSTPQLCPSISSHLAHCYFSPHSPTFVYLVLSYVTISLKVFLLIFPGPSENVKISFLRRFTSSDLNRCLSDLVVLASIAVSQPLWDRGPVNSFFIRRGPSPNKNTHKYLSNFFKFIH